MGLVMGRLSRAHLATPLLLTCQRRQKSTSVSYPDGFCIVMHITVRSFVVLLNPSRVISNNGTHTTAALELGCTDLDIVEGTGDSNR